MKININTTLARPDADEPLSLEFDNCGAFSGVFSLGLILNSKSRLESKFATDASGLHKIKEQLDYIQKQSLWGLQGIGALMISANPSELCDKDLASVGGLIQDLAKLAEEAAVHMESVNSDLFDRSNRIDGPEQAAHHAEVHREAVAIRRKRSMSYADAVAMAAGRVADAGSTEEA